MPGSTGETLLVHNGVKVGGEGGTSSDDIRRVLGYFLRFESLEGQDGKFTELDHFLVDRISRETKTSESFVVNLLNQFLTDAAGFSQFLQSGFVTWSTNGRSLFRKVRVYLRKAHRIAPVFDYTRAVRNLESLHALLSRRFFWPQITTQLALVVFVTDRNDITHSGNNYILQKNIRVLCACSAYAFHRARNKLGITKEGKLG